MNTPAPESLIYILIFIGLVLLNYLSPRIVRWLQDRQQRLRAQQQRTQLPMSVTDAGQVAVTPLPPRTVTVPIRTKQTSVSAPVRRRSTVRSHLANRDNLRQAVIMMTVLGPCRSAEPGPGSMPAEELRDTGSLPGRTRN